MNPKMRQAGADALLFEMTQQIAEIRDNFRAVLENDLISDSVKEKIRTFLAQKRNDDMFTISDLINEDIDRILKENKDISRSDFL